MRPESEPKSFFRQFVETLRRKGFSGERGIPPDSLCLSGPGKIMITVFRNPDGGCQVYAWPPFSQEGYEAVYDKNGKSPEKFHESTNKFEEWLFRKRKPQAPPIASTV
ncbi:hypothetical protein KKE03_02310 [Patescibacteria group bacterium]|nr:hypothetical protein [Patescibacteria group bacterium]